MSEQVRRRCPFCYNKLGSTGSRENISVNLSKGVYYCWRCGAAGRVTKWLANKLNVSQSYSSFYGDLDQIIFDDYPSAKKISIFPDGYVPLYPWKDIKKSIVLRRFVSHLRRRGVTPRVMKRFKLGVILDPPKDLWYTQGNLVYPILDGKRTGYIRRKIGQQGYFNSKGLSRQAALYNGRLLDKAKNIYVVEGPHDVLAMVDSEGRQHGVGTLGTSVTDDQLKRLASFDGEVIFAMDGDAWRVSMVLARRLTLLGKPSSWVKLPGGEDPGSIGYGGVVKLPTRTFLV